jgi:mRNA interferase RelE/StbE
MYQVVVNDEVVRKDLPRLSSEWNLRILTSIKAKLETSPESFGQPLRKSLKGYYKLRVGDYRVIFRIDGQYVRVIAIRHRSEVYKRVTKRP